MEPPASPPRSQRSCVVVGAGPGLGAAIARRFSREGYGVGVVARRPEAVEELAESIRSAGGRAHASAADASNEAALGAAIGACTAAVGPCEVLVYNAAIFRRTPPTELRAADLERDFAVNVAGLLTATAAVLPHMKASGAGVILATGGGLALDPWPQMASLAVGKAAIRNLTQSLAKELAPSGVHAATVTICGFIQPGTPFDPELLASVYVELAGQTKDVWEVERVVR